MRIHSDTLTGFDLIEAANAARAAFDRFEHKGSRSRDHAFDVTLTGSSNRRPNNRGQGDPDAYAATWDQWGVFLAVLFEADPNMVTPYYTDAENFADRTADRFGAPETVMGEQGYEDVFKSYGWPEDAHGDHTFRYSGTLREQACSKCRAVQRW